MKLRVWYHFSQLGRWKAINAEILSAIEASGLSTAARVRVVGLGEEAVDLPAWATWARRSAWKEWHEYATLGLLHEDCQADPEGAVCYLHSKGVLWPDDPHRNRWRADMVRHVVTRWKECVAKIEAGADTVGPWWVSREFVKDVSLPGSEALATKQYYPGNFWWASARYVASLPTPDLFDPMNRFPAEGWLCDRDDARHERIA
jgi:hypothetical protein